MSKEIAANNVYDDTTMQDLALFSIADSLVKIRYELKELREVQKKVKRFTV